MSVELHQTIEAILQELKTITAELRLLRDGLEARTSGTDAVQTAPADDMDALAQVGKTESKEVSDEKTGSEHRPTALEWLADRGITVKDSREQHAADPVFDKLALLLGTRFKTLASLHEVIRRNLSKGTSFTLNLSSKSQDEITDTTQFCTLLNDYAFISSYRYTSSTKTINATPQRTGQVINFFTGGWFERYIYQRVFSLLKEQRKQLTYLLNPRITFSTGDDFELDLFFLVEDEPLWVECKTGEYQAYISKYSSVRRLLSVPKSSSILIILGISHDLATELTYLYDITVANEANFLEKIDITAERPEVVQKEPPVPPSPSPPLELPPPVATWLNHAGLRPLPKQRRRFIGELIMQVASFTEPTPLTDLKSYLANSTESSKSQVQDLFNALVRSGCLLDDEGRVVLASNAPFRKLISDDLAVIESRCIECYRRAVLVQEPTYFDDPQNVLEFERIVGAMRPPSP